MNKLIHLTVLHTGFLALAMTLPPTILFAQQSSDPVILTGTSGFRLNTISGTSYLVPRGNSMTNLAAGANAAIYDDSTLIASSNWFIRNQGYIGWPTTGTGAAAVPFHGIYLNTTGSSTIINEAGGIIQGNRMGSNSYGTAIVSVQGPLSVINAGELYGYITLRYYKGGYLSNSGYIYGQNYALLFNTLNEDPNEREHPGLVINTGTMRSSGNYVMRLDYNNVIVQNIGGSILGDISVAGVRYQTFGAYFENTGNGVIDISGAAPGIEMQQGGTISMVSGTLRLTAGPTGNAIQFGGGSAYDGHLAVGQDATIIRTAAITTTPTTTSHYAVYVSTAGLKMENSGTILADFKAINMGSKAGNIIINNSTGVISSTGADRMLAGVTGVNFTGTLNTAITAASTSGTIINYGVISGHVRGIQANGGLTIHNYGTISASSSLYNEPAAAIYFARRTTTSNDGNWLYLYEGSDLVGDVYMDVATVNLQLQDGTFTENANFIGTGTGGLANLIKTGAGNTTLSGSLSIAGPSTQAMRVLFGGTLTLQSVANFRNASGGVYIQGANATLVLADGSSLAGPSGSAPAIVIGSGGTLAFIRGDSITHGGNITGTGNLLKDGPGVVTLSGSNSYANTVVNGGVLAGALGSGTLTVNNTGTYRATADTTMSNLFGSGRVETGAYNLLLNVTSGTTLYGFTGSLAGTGAFVKIGAGTLDLDSTGVIGLPGAAVKNGTLRLVDASQVAASLITLGDDTTHGMIDYAGTTAWQKNLALEGAGGGLSIASGEIALNATVTGAADFVKAGAGTLDITGATMDNTGNTVVADGRLRGNAGTIRGDVLIDAGATLEFAQDINAAYAGAISGSGALHKTGDGALTLTGSNTYGDTLISSGMIQGSIGVGTLTVDASGTYTMNANSDVTLAGLLGSGVVDLNNNDLAFDVTENLTGTFSFAGSLVNGNDFVKTGAGTLVLVNTLDTANALIKDGAVRVDAQEKFGSSAITLGGDDTFGLIDYTGSAPWTANLALAGGGGGLAVESGSVALNAGVSGAGDFIKSGDGTLDITAATMDNTGNTVVKAGVLRGNTDTIRGDSLIDAGAVLEFAQDASAAYAGVISGSGALRKTGEGSLTLDGANTYGDTLITAGMIQGNIGVGTLTVETSGTYKMNPGTAVTLSGILGNGTVDLNNNSLAFDVAAGVTGTFNFAGNLLNGNTVTKTGAGTLELTSPLGLAAAAIKNGTIKLDDQNKLAATTITLGAADTSGFIEYTGAAAWTKNIILAGKGGGFTIDTNAAFTGETSGDGGFYKSGTGTLDITSATMSHTGDTTILAGLLKGNSATIRGNTSVGAGAIVEFNQTAAGTYAGVISGSGALHKTGEGSLTLDGANTYGDTIIEDGTLIGTIGAGLLEIRTKGTYKVRDGQTTFTTTGISGDGTLNLNQADLLFNIADGISAFSFSGSLAGAGGNRLIKTGAGTLDLQTNSALPGGTLVEEGIVRLADQGFLNVEITLGGASTSGFLEYTGATGWTKSLRVTGQGGGFLTNDNNTVFSGTVTGDGVFIKSGSLLLDISNAILANTGGVLVNSGTLRGNSRAFSTPISVQGGAVVEFRQVEDGAFDGAITGGGSLLKTGAATLTLARPLEYTGMTIVNEGVLRAGAADLWTRTSQVTTGAAGSIDTGGFDQTVANLANNGAVIINASVNSMAGVIYEADKLTVTGTASGSGVIQVKLQESEAATDTPVFSSVIFELTGSGTAAYAAELAERHVAGAYEWAVAKSDDGKSYMLSTDQYSPEIPAIGGIDVAAYLSGEAAIGSLSRRLMAAREENPSHSFQVWANGLYREDTLGNDIYKDARAKTHGLQAGADWNNSASQTNRAANIGLFYDQVRTKTDFKDNIGSGGITPSSVTDSTGFGIYASFRPGAFYIDAMVRASKEDYEIRVPGTPYFETEGNSIAASVEIGVLLRSGSAWNIEPQLQLLLQNHSVDDATDTLGRTYEIDSASTSEVRAGVRFWREFFLRGGKSRITPYARASVIYDWDGDGAITVRPADNSSDPAFAPQRFANRIGGVICVLDVGVTYLVAPWCGLGADLGWSTGSKLKGFGGNATITFRW